MKVYVIVAYRWGENSGHNYMVAVAGDLDKAKEIAESHYTYRNGVYTCVVEEATVNEFDNEAYDYTKEVYRTA